MRWGQVLLAWLALGCSSQAADEEACRALDAKRQLCGATSITLPVVSDDQTPVVQALVNGKPVRLLLDTGAEKTTLSSTLLELPDQVLARLPELCLGKMCLRREEIYAWDSKFSAAAEGEINGFIGMSTLRDFGLTLDHGTEVDLELGGAPCAGQALSLSYTDYGSPEIDVTVDTESQSGVVIDTGATFTLLSQATVASLEPTHLEPKKPASLCTVNGCTDGVAFTAELPVYCAGAVCENDVPVKFPVFDAVGSSFLSRRRAAFDFAGNQLVFCAD